MPRGRYKRFLRALLAVVCVVVLGFPPGAGAQTGGGVGTVLDAAGELLGACSALDPAHCLLPFPNNEFTTTDSSTPTGMRVDLSPLAMPANVAGKPVDPTEWNRNDGWSPGSMLLTFVPGLDLQRTWGIGHLHHDQPSLSLAPDAPMVIIDTSTGERHPFWSELDTHPETSDDARLLIIRPLRNFDHGKRYVVGLRNLRNSDGALIPASDIFAQQRSAFMGGSTDPVLGPLAAAGVEVSDLYLAWDFTIASAENVTGRALAIRDDAFAQLGDNNLADGVVSGAAPQFVIDEVEERSSGDTARLVFGRLTVPNYLTLPQGGPLGLLEDVGLGDLAGELGLGETLDMVLGELPDLPVPVDQMTPGSRLNYEDPLGSAPMDAPVQNPVFPTMEAEFRCAVPATATASSPARPFVYGHGLLGSQREATGGSTREMREDNFAPCAVDWIGMSEKDILNALLILLDLSNFPSLADRSQQGFLNFSYLGRALIHPDGFGSHPAFQDASGNPLLNLSELFYDGNSQGAIMGGPAATLSPDITKAVLGVPGMNYSTLLHRSVDWEGPFIDELGLGFASLMYTAYPDKWDQLVGMALIQMLWDRAETNGYAHFFGDRALPNSPHTDALLHVALGDYQVAPISAEVEARTMGARFLQTALPEGRHWADPYGDRLFDHTPFDVAQDGSLVAHGGSALVYWDSANPQSPSANIPPEDFGLDPHGDPRQDPHAQDQKRQFYLTGEVGDVHDLRPYCTNRFPRHEEESYDCSIRMATTSAEAAALVEADEGLGPTLPATGGGAMAGGLVLILGALITRRLLLSRTP